MIASLFSKTRPINYALVLIMLFSCFFLYQFQVPTVNFTTGDLFSKIFVFLLLLLSFFLVNFISSNMNADVATKQQLLEMVDMKERATRVLEYLTKELQMLELKNQIQSKVKVDIDKQQREYFLNQQLKTIQEELGGSAHDQEINDLKDRATHKKWSKEVAEVFNKEIERLLRINPAAAEYSVTLNYLELLRA